MEMKNEIAKVQEYAKILSLANLAEDDTLFDGKTIKQINFLKEVFECEIQIRKEKGIEKRYKASHLPEIKTFEEFDLTFNKKITQKMIDKLISLDWLCARYNVIFVGGAGSGKSHLALALGYKVIQGGYKVAFTTFYELIIMLKSKEHIKNYERRFQYIKECQLLIIDEVGYTDISREDSNLFYQFLNSINGKVSIIITTNLEFSLWDELLGDEVLATAIVDRLTHRCQIISTHGKSYRLAHHKNIYNINK